MHWLSKKDRAVLRKSGLWFPRFVIFNDDKVAVHHAHAAKQHKHEKHPETKSRAIMRLFWERKRLGWRGFWGLLTIVMALSLVSVQSNGQSPLNRDNPLGARTVSITFQNSGGTKIVTFAAPFNFKCSTNMTCSVTGNTVTVSAAGGGAGGGYATIQNAGAAIAQEATLNFLGSFACVDNPGNASSDCKLTASSAVTHQFVTGVDSSGNYLRGRPVSTDLSDVSATTATDGQILIFDGPSSTYIPGDPRVQGLAADGATTVLNPVEIGGYDTAGTPAIHRAIWLNAAPSGTEYGEVVRNIPSGTQAVSGSVSVSNFPATQPVSGTVTVTQATGTNLHTVVDSAPTTAVTVAATLNVQGAKTNNSAAPGATNVGTLPAVANAAAPSFTEANQTALSTDLAGNLRVYNHPPNVLGCYMVNGRTPVYAAQIAGAPLYSFRWGTATGALAVIMRVRVNVATTVTSTTNSGAAERELVVARGFTASDTGGTAIVLTGNNQKMRTSQATSLVTDMRAGGPLTAGTRTLDANPISSVLSWLGINFIGIDIGSGGASTTAASWTGLGGVGMIPLLDAVNGQDYPLVLAQNEGFIIRIGKDAQPTGFSQQTYFNISWCEVSAY